MIHKYTKKDLTFGSYAVAKDLNTSCAEICKDHFENGCINCPIQNMFNRLHYLEYHCVPNDYRDTRDVGKVIGYVLNTAKAYMNREEYHNLLENTYEKVGIKLGINDEN